MEKLSLIIIFWLLNLTFYFICGIVIYSRWKSVKEKESKPKPSEFRIFTFALKGDNDLKVQIKIKSKNEETARLILSFYVDKNFIYYLYKVENTGGDND